MNATPEFRRPESVLVVVYASDGQALVLRRADQPELWQSVTGSLHQSETPEQAARRELAEETGFEGQPEGTGVTRRFRILPHWQSRFEPGTEWNLEHEFRFELAQPMTPTLNPEEHLEFRWLPLAGAARRVFSWTNREALEALHV